VEKKEREREYLSYSWWIIIFNMLKNEDWILELFNNLSIDVYICLKIKSFQRGYCVMIKYDIMYL
jgi:hypothetical protein